MTAAVTQGTDAQPQKEKNNQAVISPPPRLREYHGKWDRKNIYRRGSVV